jgi:hypothetical protein
MEAFNAGVHQFREAKAVQPELASAPRFTPRDMLLPRLKMERCMFGEQEATAVMAFQINLVHTGQMALQMVQTGNTSTVVRRPFVPSTIGATSRAGEVSCPLTLVRTARRIALRPRTEAGFLS